MNARNQISHTALAAVLCLSSFVLPGVVYAQDNESSGPVLDEILVTAQKRSQSLQDVPISMQAISGAQIQEKGIQRLEELASEVPNFTIQQDPIGDKINIRGVQSGNNAGLEQSVSTFVDGVYRGRGIQSRFSFLDPGRIEVLRGPQGTLFGKNTIGGAINIETAKPTQDLDAMISGTYGFEGVEEYEVRGHVSGAVSDKVRGRVAFLYHDLDKGWVDNLYYNQDEPTVEEYALRGTLEFDLSPQTMLTAKVEYGDWDQFGQPLASLTAGPLSAFGVQDENYDQSQIGSVNSILDVGSAGNFRGNNMEGVLTLNHQLDKGDITAIVAYSAYDFYRECDCDFSLADVLRFDDSEDFEQYSLELRYASNLGGPFEFIVGGYTHYNTLLATGDTQINTRGLADGELGVDTLLAAGCAGSGFDPSTRSCILNGLVSAFDGSPLAYDDLGRLHALDQEDTVYAIFGQATYDLSEKFSVTGGLRYTIEDKTATQSAIATIFGTHDQHPIFGQGLYAASGYPGLDPFLTLAEAETHENDLDRSENSLTWSVDLQYRASDNANFYAKAATGFKAGGYNSFALSADPDEAEYEDEKVKSGEIGAKFRLFNGAAELNTAIFYSEFTDLQTALFTGSTSFIVQNAAEANTKGIEVDGRWALSDNAKIHGSIAYVDFTFDSYPNAGCTVDQLLNFRDVNNAPLATLQTCATAGVNDLAGRTSENTPKISAALGFTNDWSITDKLEGHFGIDLIYAGSQYRQADLDPFMRDQAHTMINGVIGFSAANERWRFDLIGKNLTDVDSFSYANDAPLIDLSRQFLPNRPRTVAVRVTLRN